MQIIDWTKSDAYDDDDDEGMSMVEGGGGSACSNATYVELKTFESYFIFVWMDWGTLNLWHTQSVKDK